MEGKHVFANASFSSLRGWDLQFSGWRLIWKMGVEDKCYFKVIMKRIFLAVFCYVFFSLLDYIVILKSRLLGV